MISMRLHFWALGLILLFFFVTPAHAVCQAMGDVQCGTIPTNGCDVNVNVTFVSGTYNLPEGVDICLSNMTLNCNGATLVGSGTGLSSAVTSFFPGADILNCHAQNYFVGYALANASGSEIRNSTSMQDLLGQSIRVAVSPNSILSGNTLSGSIVVASDNVTVENNQVGESIVVKSLTGGTIGGLIIGNTAKGVLLEQNTTGVTVQDNNIQNNLAGINIDSSPGNLILNNMIQNSSLYGILITNSPSTILRQNSVTGSAARWIWAQGGSTNLLIEDNQFNVGTGIELDASHNSIVKGNTFLSGCGLCIYAVDSDGVRAEDNQFMGYGQIYFSSSDFGYVEFNQFNSEDGGINFTDAIMGTVNGNTFDGEDGGSIFLAQGHSHVVTENNFNQGGTITVDSNNNTISANFIFNQEDDVGIIVSGTGNVVEDNSINSPYSGIVLLETENNLLRNNVISNPLVVGVYALGGNAEGEPNILQGNTITGSQDLGIFLQDTVNMQVLENTIQGNEVGIETSDVEDTNVYHNTIQANGINLINHSGELVAEENYWGLSNAFGNQDCAAIDQNILDWEDYFRDGEEDGHGGRVDFNPILDAPFDAGGVLEDKCTPVLLIHGIYSSDAMWSNDVTDELTQKGMRFYKVGEQINQGGLFPNNSAIQQLAGQAALAIQQVKRKTGEKKIDVLAHSMGGLVTRAYTVLSPLYQNDVRKLMMLGTPNEGAPIAKKLIAGFVGFVQGTDPTDQGRKDMIPGFPFLTKLNAKNPTVTHHAIAGTKLTENNPLKSLLCDPILGDPQYCDPTFISDTIVPAASVNYSGSCHQYHATHTPLLGPSIYDQALPMQAAVALLIQETPSLAPCTIPTATPESTSMEAKKAQGNVGAGQIVTPISGIAPNGYFETILQWQAGPLMLHVKTPTGQDINRNSYQNFPGVTHHLDGNSESFAITTAQPGDWAIRVSSQGQAGTYELSLFRKTDVAMDHSTDKDTYLPGQPIIARTLLKTGGNPILNATVKGTLSLPSGGTTTLSLFDDGLHQDGNAGDGMYANSFITTSAEGYYPIDLNAVGVSPLGSFELTARTAAFVTAPIDLEVSAEDVVLSNQYPAPNQPLVVTASISNLGTGNATDVNIVFGNGNPFGEGIILGSTVVTIPAGQTIQVPLNWTPDKGEYELYVIVNPYHAFLDENYSNEMTIVPVTVCRRTGIVGGGVHPACADIGTGASTPA